jgi:hypothetical protein
MSVRRLAGGPGAWNLSRGLGNICGLHGKNGYRLRNNFLNCCNIEIFGLLLQRRLQFAHVETIRQKNAQKENN